MRPDGSHPAISSHGQRLSPQTVLLPMIVAEVRSTGGPRHVLSPPAPVSGLARELAMDNPTLEWVAPADMHRRLLPPAVPAVPGCA